MREAKLVMTLPPHQNVVQTFGLTNDGFNLMLVMEYCNGGALDVKLFDLPDPVSDKEKLAILIGIAQGMQHLHQNKIIHRDLAARNILINNNVPKVSVSRSVTIFPFYRLFDTCHRTLACPVKSKIFYATIPHETMSGRYDGW